MEEKNEQVEVTENETTNEVTVVEKEGIKAKLVKHWKVIAGVTAVAGVYVIGKVLKNRKGTSGVDDPDIIDTEYEPLEVDDVPDSE